MVELNEQQIELISAYIKQHGVAQDDLHDDLLDHVCTSIERQMDQGESFENAFAKTIKLFGPGGLKQVQQQTFELLTEMNNAMKKVTFSFGLTSAILLLAGTIFKLMHWPGANIGLMLGAIILILGYLPLLLFHKLKESPRSEALMHITGFAGLSLTALGSIFKIMHWPGAAVILITGIGILGALYIPIYFFKRYKTSANKPVTLSTSIVAMTCVILVLALVSVRNSSEFDRAMALVQMDMEEASERMNRNDELYASLNEDPASTQLRDRADQTWQFLQDMKIYLISETENIHPEAAAKIPVNELERKYNYDIPSHIMWQPDTSSPYHIVKLIETLREYESIVLGNYPSSMQEKMKSLMPYNIDQSYAHRGIDEGWGKYHFYKVPLASVVAQLTKLQVDVRSLETQTLMYLISRPAASDPPSGS